MSAIAGASPAQADAGLPARGSRLGRAVAGLSRRARRGDRLPGAGLFALRLWPLRPARSAARRRLHASRGARDAAGAARRARPRRRHPGRPQRRRVDRADPCRQRALAGARRSSLEAPHVFVEDFSVASIAAARDAYATPICASASRATTTMSTAPSAAGTTSGSRRISAPGTSRTICRGVRCPVLAIQGADDEYGTLAQIDAIARGVAGPFERWCWRIASTRRIATRSRRRSRRWRASSRGSSAWPDQMELFQTTSLRGGIADEAIQDHGTSLATGLLRWLAMTTYSNKRNSL